ncbi:MAG TPA: hypothetical protein VM597_36925 [Gemmataceae bacterium]|nr:hypothetical protein [Gemmataceae bacterium]
MPIEDDDDRPRRPRRDDRDDRPRGRDDGYDDRSRRRRRDDDDRDDYHDDGRSRRPDKQVSVCGVIALVKGIGALLLSFVPCIGAFAVFPGALGLLLGIIGLVIAKKSNGRQGTGIPIAGVCVSIAAILISLVWWGLGMAMSNRADQMVKQMEADIAAEKARRAEENKKALHEIESAADPIRLTAVELDTAYDDDRAAADRRYMNKIVEVTGKVSRVNRLNKPELTVELEGMDVGRTVDCEFATDPDGKVDALRAGQQVTIRGKCIGRVGAWVELKPCVLVVKKAP